jgi:hypothetical protein
LLSDENAAPSHSRFQDRVNRGKFDLIAAILAAVGSELHPAAFLSG